MVAIASGNFAKLVPATLGNLFVAYTCSVSRTKLVGFESFDYEMLKVESNQKMQRFACPRHNTIKSTRKSQNHQ